MGQSARTISEIFIFIMDEPFPIGMACTNRILSLSRGFVELNIRVNVISLRPTERVERGIVNKDARGTIDGIRWEYTCGTTTRGKNVFHRRWLRIKGLIRASGILRASKARPGAKALIAYLESPVHLALFYALSRVYRIMFVQDHGEYPFVLRKKSFFGKLYARLYTRYVYRLFDAMFVMTKSLEEYYRTRMNRKAKLLRALMTVEVSRFLNGASPRPDEMKYIAYCGYVGGQKDGVPNLVKSFSIVHRSFPDVKLYIIGDAPGTGDLENLKTLSVNLGIGNHVVFTGSVRREEMPRYLCNAAILALARPSSMQSDGGFPSKLGEYLATGNPVVVTKVGDIPLYLNDCENAFLVEPDDVEGFARKIEYVLSHQDLAREVGRRGREVAVGNFDYRIQAGRIVRFLENI